ncbi:MAG: prepilin-type N-terminal cleavage/methylation domain-containing protein [Pirellulaceae bacterium]|nr:prepilin-type N-terminal cleavage/methylation domain-containing protein [Pirellulaceae bacterium]
MSTNSAIAAKSRRAFTLIELIVVLTILVGLAGILIPTVTNMVGRTNRSTTAANISEISGAIQRFEAIYVEYPDNFDSLMSNLATGVTLNTLNPGLTAVIEDLVLDADTLAALNNAGIVNVGQHAVDDTTFVLPTLTPLLATSTIKGLTAAHQQAIGIETTGVAGKYAAFGLGTLSEMTGKLMADAPVHFPRDRATNPDTVYSRFIAIFQITDGTDALTRARFTGVIAPDGQPLSDQLGGYFNISANE